MRTSILYSAAGLTFLMTSGMECCGVGGPELTSLAPDYECAYFNCALVVGGETVAEVFTGGATVTDVTLDPPVLADLAVDGTRITLRPRIAGDGTITVKLSDGYPITMPVQTGALVSTEVVPDRAIAGFRLAYPPGGKQMFAGSTLRVVAEHRGANKVRLLGHGFEDWTVTGGTFVVPPANEANDTGLDTALLRDVVAGTGPLVSVGARAGNPPLEIEVVPAGSTRTLELAFKTGNARYGTLTMANYDELRVPVSAFSADGRFIHGVPTGGALTARVTDSSIVGVTVSTADRSLRLAGLAPGTTDLIVEFDGATARFTLTLY